MNLFKYILVIGFCVFAWGCDSADSSFGKIDEVEKGVPPSQFPPPKNGVRMDWSGGWGQYGWISINSDGWLSDHRYQTFLPLSTQLDSVRHAQVMSWFDSMQELPESAYGGCADGITWTFTKMDYVNQKELIRSFNCEVRIDTQWEQLIMARDSLLNLSEWFHSVHDPWIGVEYKIEYDSKKFTQSDTLVARLELFNPTDNQRTYYFTRTVNLAFDHWVAGTYWGGENCAAINSTCEVESVEIPAGQSVSVYERVPVRVFVNPTISFPQDIRIYVYPSVPLGRDLRERLVITINE